VEEQRQFDAVLALEVLGISKTVECLLGDLFFSFAQFPIDHFKFLVPLEGIDAYA